jgi:DNA uptake protein ComE-like DNA-binding protein
MSRVIVAVVAVLVASATLAGAQAQMPKAAGDAVKAVTGPLDLNSASLDQLKALPGVGEQYAKKIVDGRPFKKVDELMSKKIVPQSVYDQIKGLVAIK